MSYSPKIKIRKKKFHHNKYPGKDCGDGKKSNTNFGVGFMANNYLSEFNSK